MGRLLLLLLLLYAAALPSLCAALSGDCADAYVMLANNECKWQGEALATAEKGYAAAVRARGGGSAVALNQQGVNQCWDVFEAGDLLASQTAVLLRAFMRAADTYGRFRLPNRCLRHLRVLAGTSGVW